ncbi:MAG: hypothetical protein U9M95_00610, partial [Candidatus Altiarchaeota archaeon]|nr:hypothetical protein [Candidatus Altiarchaeota archaeon]
MKNKKIRAFMDRYPEFMLALTILAILSIVFSSTVSPYSNDNIEKITATTTTSSSCYYRCTDTDGGSVYERGYVSIVRPSGCPTTTARFFQDYCMDETTLMEYDCDENNKYHTQRQVNCKCSNGACISQTFCEAWDIDDNEKVDSDTDGKLVMNYLFGFT